MEMIVTLKKLNTGRQGPRAEVRIGILSPIWPGWKSGESNIEIADKIYTQFIHINISAQILYKLLWRFIHLPIAAPIQIHLELTIVERQKTDCDSLYLTEQQT